MGKNYVTNHINLNELLVLLGVLTELRIPLRDEGFGISNGIIFLSETSNVQKRFVQVLKHGMVNTVSVSSILATKAKNFEIAVHEYCTYDKPEQIVKYLNSEFFTPALLLHGTLPEFLQENQNVFPVEEKNMEDINSAYIAKSLSDFLSYARQNPKEIFTEIQNLKTCRFFSDDAEVSLFILNFKFAINLFCRAYRANHTETETVEKQEQLVIIVDCLSGICAQCISKCDVASAVQKEFFAFFDETDDICVENINNLEEKTFEAVQKERAILFDTDYYFIPESLFREACSNLTDCISFPSIKQNLHESGFLQKNNTTASNYTVKKIIVSSYGATLRLRFLKIRKNLFATIDGLNLEERRCSRCT